MWRVNLIKLAQRLNTYIEASGAGNWRFFRPLKNKVKTALMRLLNSDNLQLVTLNGMGMYVYSHVSTVQEYVLRSYEPYMAGIFKRAIRPGGTVLDIGAQFGYFSLIAAKCVGRDGRVYAFEPVPANFELLKRNIHMNGLSHIVHPIQKAVGDKRSTVKFFVYEGSDSHAMYRHPLSPVKEEIFIESITIDEFLEGQAVDVIKMDIEGNEPYALKGMKNTIAMNDNLILFAELAPSYLLRAGVNPEDYVAQIEMLGFDAQCIDEDSSCLRPVPREPRAQADINPSWHSNLYCVKRKR